MNYYEQRLSKLDKEILPKEVFGQGDTSVDNEFFLKKIKINDKVFVNGWFLRDIDDINSIESIAKNGLTVIEISKVGDQYGEWKMGNWKYKEFKSFWFKESLRPMSSKYVLGQFIWKIERNKKVIYKIK